VFVNPLPGVDRDGLVAALTSVRTAVAGVRGKGAGRPTHERLLDYLGWANEAEQTLRHLLPSREVERLVRTRKFDHLLSLVGRFGPDMAFARVNGLLAAELDERVDAFDAAIKALEERIRRWRLDAIFVVLDTTVYIEHPQELEAIDLRQLVNRRGEDIHVLVPMVVVDELDGLKQHQRARTRARLALRTLDQLFARSAGSVRLRARDLRPLDSGDIPFGEVTMEVLLDPPGHRRLPINDDEIVDRAVAAQPLAGQTITLVTYDTGLAMRARSAGLAVVKLQPAASS
jgi:rRNA-processing protein FCF1